MKIALTYAFLAVGGIALFSNGRAAAQYGYAPEGESARYAMQTSPRTRSGGNAQSTPAAGAASAKSATDSTAAGSGTAETIAAPAPSAAGQPPEPATPVATDESLLDNGLWPGAPMGPCCANCCDGYGPPPDWGLEQGVRVLARDRPREAPISFEFALAPTTIGNALIEVPIYTEVFDVHNGGFTAEPGYYATISHYVCRDCGGHDDYLEFTYWGFNSWNASATFAPGRLGSQQVIQPDPTVPVTYHIGRLNTQFKVNNVNENSLNTGLDDPTTTIGVVGFDGADTQSFTESSRTQDFELNFRIHPRPNPNQLVLHPDGRWRLECDPGWDMSYLVGLRYINISEGFFLNSQGIIGTFLNETQVASNNVSGQYAIQTENNLLGLQIGADVDYHACKWSCGVHTKLGPYVNWSHAIKDIVNNPAGLPTMQTFDNQYSINAQRASLLGEVSLQGTYRFRPNLIGRASFDFMWITGLALGADQLTWQIDPQGNDTINTNGTVFYYGPTLSLEWVW